MAGVEAEVVTARIAELKAERRIEISATVSEAVADVFDDRIVEQVAA